ncbi:AAA family ATPase [Stieleria varia]|uniref:Stage V sporulation protein K n=1 Tax=Stieleria varia TaxID=2528005 RepID=A0A5C6B6T5_9BACT|nr:AAA family ATPase [Stieleria varia]TWU07477.1 Stage V sporulation protein K [Stieleria varia]
MSDDHARLDGMLRRVLRDCSRLYQSSAKSMIKRYPTMIEGGVDGFAELMDDLHRGLLIKVYVTIVRADERWTGPEKRVASTMIEHLWGENLHGTDLREAATGLFQQSDQLSWTSLVAPFVRYEPLANNKAHVDTIVMRLANLVAKCDGQMMPNEAIALQNLQREIDLALHPPKTPLLTPNYGSHANAQQQQYESEFEDDDQPPMTEEERQRRLDTAMAELDELVGLQSVKDRVRSYANFLRLQQTRRDKGLATMPISLHMTFVGNPGTGKTTVARIVGQILGAMGTLENGHVVETDRSGLVAEYAGQTATKTNKLCDSALGGVLFIDEAYSLVDASGDDSYGREAVQTLLKRMEDDRDSLAVILAGYCDEMDHLIRSNPGLSSRINTTIDFDDYQPSDMGLIFEKMCQANQYDLPADARHRLLLGLDRLYHERDRHFGNGRLVRNAFEDSVRKLADRVASVTVLSEDLLTTLTVDDISVPGLSPRQLDRLAKETHRLVICCGGCQRKIRVQPETLGRRVRCTQCSHVQLAAWANIDRPSEKQSDSAIV